MTRKRKRPPREEGTAPGIALAYISPQEVTGGMIPRRLKEEPQQLALLAASISRYGLLSPPIVRRTEGAAGYRLICGARRLAACRLLNMESIPVIVIDADAAQAAACFMEEHLCRRAPCAIDEAQMIEATGGADAVKASVLSAAAYSRRLSLLSLDEQTRRIAQERELTLEQAEPLLSIEKTDWRHEAARIIADRGLGGAQARRLVFGPRAEMQTPVMTGKRRALQAATREIEQLREKLCRMGIDTQISMLSRGEGVCIQLTLRETAKENGKEKRDDSANT